MKKLNVWLVSDGLPGHYNQSHGLMRALQQQCEISLETVEVRLRSKPLRPLMRWLLTAMPAMTGLNALRLFYRLENGLPASRPDIILSAGGNTLFANAVLARQYLVANYFSGTLKGYPASLYQNVFSVVPLKNAPNNVVLDLPPTNVEPGASNGETRSGLYVLLIGGDGAGYRYSEDDWRRLAQSVNTIASKHNIRWLITTSRRSGELCESVLSEQIDTAIVEQAVWYGRKPERVMQKFLQQADTVFCTEDSLTMVAESIYANRPVVTLQPEIAAPDDNDSQALAQYVAKGYISRVQMSEVEALTVQESWTAPDFAQQDRRVREVLLSAVGSTQETKR